MSFISDFYIYFKLTLDALCQTKINIDQDTDSHYNHLVTHDPFYITTTPSISPCFPNPCYNGSACAISNLTISKYICFCKFGLTGILSQFEISLKKIIFTSNRTKLFN